MTDKEIKELYELLKLINSLKLIDRFSLIEKNGRCESVAEHTWHLCMAVWLFSIIKNKELDLLKCFKMALIHDLTEIYSGDYFPYKSDIIIDDIIKNEKESLDILIKKLPVKLGNEILSLVQEFNERKTDESKFVWSMDRFMPYLQYKISDGDMTDNVEQNKDFKQKQEIELIFLEPLLYHLFVFITKNK